MNTLAAISLAGFVAIGCACKRSAPTTAFQTQIPEKVIQVSFPGKPTIQITWTNRMTAVSVLTAAGTVTNYFHPGVRLHIRHQNGQRETFRLDSPQSIENVLVQSGDYLSVSTPIW